MQCSQLLLKSNGFLVFVCRLGSNANMPPIGVTIWCTEEYLLHLQLHYDNVRVVLLSILYIIFYVSISVLKCVFSVLLLAS
jgi:hypothetical protein